MLSEELREQSFRQRPLSQNPHRYETIPTFSLSHTPSFTRETYGNPMNSTSLADSIPSSIFLLDWAVEVWFCTLLIKISKCSCESLGMEMQRMRIKTDEARIKESLSFRSSTLHMTVLIYGEESGLIHSL